MFLEWWNATKSHFNIWQHFSCLLNKETANICKKLNSHVFLRADQVMAKHCCQIGCIGCPMLQVAQEATVRFQFLVYFCNPLISYQQFGYQVLTHDKRFQMVERLFVVFYHSRNILWGPRPSLEFIIIYLKCIANLFHSQNSIWMTHIVKRCAWICMQNTTVFHQCKNG